MAKTLVRYLMSTRKFRHVTWLGLPFSGNSRNFMLLLKVSRRRTDFNEIKVPARLSIISMYKVKVALNGYEWWKIVIWGAFYYEVGVSSRGGNP